MEEKDPTPVTNAEARTSTGLRRVGGTHDLGGATEAILKYEGVFELMSMQEVTEREKDFSDQEQKLRAKMSRVRHKIAVISGKGGVGKSTVAVNLAVAFAMHGHADRIGILDADIHGPTVPRMLGLTGQRLQVGPPGAFPASGTLGIKVVSMDFLMPDENAAVIWRGPLKMTAIRQFLSEIVWGDLDILLIDLPPGTGDEPLSIAQLLPEMDGVIIVTIPSKVSQVVVKKSVTFARQLGMPIIGVIENMSGFICPDCGKKSDIFESGGGQKISEELNIAFLGSIPIDQRICEDADRGEPFIVEHPDSAASKSFMEIVRKIEDFLKQKAKK
ncbi:MAG TPA: Mrp/NBP35 family ATP-binding protein [candidate division Zixibacteria bacterium]|nr:Mrp/NBP35 family ATP-binding protein [candidate division Zixibacteria bacterium]